MNNNSKILLLNIPMNKKFYVNNHLKKLFILASIILCSIIFTGNRFYMHFIQPIQKHVILKQKNTNNVNTFKQIQLNINSLHLLENLNIKVDEMRKTVLITGFLNDAESEAFYNNIKILEKQTFSNYKFNTQIKNVEDELPFKINEIYTGNLSYIVVNDNQKLITDSMYLNVTIESISNHAVIFKYNNQNITLLINSNTESSTNKLNGHSATLPSPNNYDNVNDLTNRSEILNYERQTMENNIIKDNNQKIYLEQIFNAANSKLKSIIKNQIDQVNQDILINQHELQLFKATE